MAAGLRLRGAPCHCVIAYKAIAPVTGGHRGARWESSCAVRVLVWICFALPLTTGMQCFLAMRPTIRINNCNFRHSPMPTVWISLVDHWNTFHQTVLLVAAGLRPRGAPCHCVFSYKAIAARLRNSLRLTLESVAILNSNFVTIQNWSLGFLSLCLGVCLSLFCRFSPMRFGAKCPLG